MPYWQICCTRTVWPEGVICYVTYNFVIEENNIIEKSWLLFFVDGPKEQVRLFQMSQLQKLHHGIYVN